MFVVILLYVVLLPVYTSIKIKAVCQPKFVNIIYSTYFSCLSFSSQNIMNNNDESKAMVPLKWSNDVLNQASGKPSID